MSQTPDATYSQDAVCSRITLAGVQIARPECCPGSAQPGRFQTSGQSRNIRAEQDGVHPTLGPRRRLSEKPQERKWDLAWPLGGKSLTSNPSPESNTGETSWLCNLGGWGLRTSWAQVWPLPPQKNKPAPHPSPLQGAHSTGL